MIETESHTHRTQLSLPEYGLVAAYVGLQGLIGVTDPFEGLDPAQQAQALEAASAALQQRGLLAVDDASQSVELDAVTAALVKATGLAERIVVLSLKTEDDYAQRIVFVGPELIVEQESADDQVTLTAVRDGETLAQRTVAFLACAHRGGGVGEAFPLGLETLAEAQRLRSEPEACREAVAAGGVAAEAAQALSDALCGPHQLGSLSIHGATLGEDAERALAFLVAPEASWLLLHGDPDADAVTVRPASVQEIEAQVREMALVAASAFATPSDVA